MEQRYFEKYQCFCAYSESYDNQKSMDYLQNIFFCVSQKKEMHRNGKPFHFWVNYPFKTVKDKETRFKSIFFKNA